MSTSTLHYESTVDSTQAALNDEAEALKTARTFRQQAKHAAGVEAAELLERAEELEESAGVNDVRDYVTIMLESDSYGIDDQTDDGLESNRGEDRHA